MRGAEVGKLRDTNTGGIKKPPSLRYAIPGSWALEQTIEGSNTNMFLNLNADASVAMPPGTPSGVRDNRMRWKLKDNEFAIEAPKRSSLSSGFMERTYLGTFQPGSGQIEGTILEGEHDPEYVGRFVLKQVLSTGSIPAPGTGTSLEWEWDGEVDEAVHSAP
eukprot:CAMPEP_0181324742 /NCGR_PEP_ID=MMETSP1101-20121128/20532_1 /TAXON_ID=46948 /ORGANISM="Rhodomonas abbreviata, Strain Caron Lab Isolate" /LENGTH=161 /DNA_ID=CAMNT_0023432959 /DNA_START=322 /DNA_END=807 /DNA_ORIENTATION=+